MDDGPTLFFSLPMEAQAALRARVDRRNPGNVRALTRAIYPWVQTLAEAQCVAEFLVAEPYWTARPAEQGSPVRSDAASHVSSRIGAVPTVPA